MARPIRLTTSGVSTSGLAPLDIHKCPFSVTINVVVTGTVTYTVQFTTDNIFAASFDPATAAWVSHPDATDATATAAIMLVAPVYAVRVNQTAGAGSTATAVIQAGIASN